MRSEDYFDAGAKYHVAANVGYVRYFTAFVYEFQFYRTLCLISKQYDPNDPKKPLHRCNFYGSKEAGDKLDSMLKLGSSKPWKDAMEVRVFILGIFWSHQWAAHHMVSRIPNPNLLTNQN